MNESLRLWYQATMQMLKRYRLVFDQVWQDRKKLDTGFRLPHETEFLPAALELIETPVHPARALCSG